MRTCPPSASAASLIACSEGSDREQPANKTEAQMIQIVFFMVFVRDITPHERVFTLLLDGISHGFLSIRYELQALCSRGLQPAFAFGTLCPQAAQNAG